MALDKNIVTLCWPNLIGKSTLSGGSYVPSLPLNLVRDEVFAIKCKTTDLLPESTQFEVLLNRVRPVHVVAIAAHNFSAAARYRIRLFAEDGALLEDSGVVDVWPEVYKTSQLEWEYDNFWSGTLDEEERGQYTPLMTHFTENRQMTKRIKVELFDGDNLEGHLKFGRVFIADAWQPSVNASYGIQHGFDSADVFEEATDRTEYVDAKRLRRTASMTFDSLDTTEAYQRLYSMQRTEGMHGEVLYSFDTNASPENFVRTFIARQRDLNPIEQPYYDNHANSLNLLEVL